MGPRRKRLKRATPGGIPGWIKLLKTNCLRLTADVCSNMEMVEVVAAIIERGGEILIGQRKAEQSHPLKWEFPGGKVEADSEVGKGTTIRVIFPIAV